MDKKLKIFLITFFTSLWFVIIVFVSLKTEAFSAFKNTFAQQKKVQISQEQKNKQKREKEEQKNNFFEHEGIPQEIKPEEKIREEVSTQEEFQDERKENTTQESPQDFQEEEHLKTREDSGNIKPNKASVKKASIKTCGDFRCYSGKEFVDLYNHFEEQSALPYLKKYIYNNSKADQHIRLLAERRGYRQRVFANEKTDIVPFENHQTRREVRDAYIKMRDEMKKEGIELYFVSGYRSSSHQRRIFKNKMGNIYISKIPSGVYDKKINTILEKSSIPGYSRHHSGYAVDFGCGNNSLNASFKTTACYSWLSKNNFENAKRFGFIPSYPEGVESQGPNPEPWEFVWVGVENLQHGI